MRLINVFVWGILLLSAFVASASTTLPLPIFQPEVVVLAEGEYVPAQPLTVTIGGIYREKGDQFTIERNNVMVRCKIGDTECIAVKRQANPLSDNMMQEGLVYQLKSAPFRYKDVIYVQIGVVGTLGATIAPLDDEGGNSIISVTFPDRHDPIRLQYVGRTKEGEKATKREQLASTAQFHDTATELYAMRIDGHNLQRLTYDYSYEQHLPVFSRDGSRAVILSRAITAPITISTLESWSVDSALATPVLLGNILKSKYPDQHVALSPDGRSVYIPCAEWPVYLACIRNNLPPFIALSTVPLAQPDKQYVLDEIGDVPDASPDGALITYCTVNVDKYKDAAQFPPYTVIVANPVTKQKQTLGPGYLPKFSDDGKLLCYYLYATSGERTVTLTPQIFRLSSQKDGTIQLTRVVSDVDLTNELTFFMPDSKRMALLNGKHGIRIFDLTSAKITDITPVTDIERMVTLPDGKSLLYLKEGHLYIVDVQRKKTLPLKGISGINDFTVTPDGKMIYFLAKPAQLNLDGK